MENNSKFMGCLVLFFPWLGLASAQSTSFSVDHATVDIDSCLNVPIHELEFSCHRLKRGDGIVVASRNYRPQEKTDDDAYFKTTFVFSKKPEIGKVVSIPSSDIFIFHSYGASSFPGVGGCYGSATSGTIDVESIDRNGIKLKYKLNFNMKSPHKRKGECSENDIREDSLNAPFMKFQDLNPWLGLESKSIDIWSEAHLH